MNHRERMAFVHKELVDLLTEFTDGDVPVDDFDATDYANTIVGRWEADLTEVSDQQ